MSSKTRGIVPPERVRKWVIALDKEMGTKGASETIDVSRETIARIMAGMTVRKATISHVEKAMAADKEST